MILIPFNLVFFSPGTSQRVVYNIPLLEKVYSIPVFQFLGNRQGREATGGDVCPCHLSLFHHNYIPLETEKLHQESEGREDLHRRDAHGCHLEGISRRKNTKQKGGLSLCGPAFLQLVSCPRLTTLDVFALSANPGLFLPTWLRIYHRRSGQDTNLQTV